ncbi:MAG: protein YgfX [Pseudomonadota bacterium]
MVVFHMLALLATVTAVLPHQKLQWLLQGLVLVSLAYNLYVSVRARQIIWHAGNRWTLKNTSTRQPQPDYFHATLTSVDFLSRWLVIITLKADKKRAERVVIPFDSMDKDSYRLFRVRLRIEGHGLINPNDPSKAE